MGACGEWWQRLATRVAKFQQMDAVGDHIVARDAQPHCLRRSRGGHSGFTG
jgi:hypothetical protein